MFGESGRPEVRPERVACGSACWRSCSPAVSLACWPLPLVQLRRRTRPPSATTTGFRQARYSSTAALTHFCQPHLEAVHGRIWWSTESAAVDRVRRFLPGAASGVADDALACAMRAEKLDRPFVPKHNVDPLLQYFGSREAVVEQILIGVKGFTPASGTFDIPVTVGGQPLTRCGASWQLGMWGGVASLGVRTFRGERVRLGVVGLRRFRSVERG